MGRPVADLAVGNRRSKRIVVLPTRAGDELPDAAAGGGRSTWILRSEALIYVIVPVQHDVRALVVKLLEERANGVDAGPVFTRGEKRMVPVRERAARAAGRQVVRKPATLRGGRPAAANRTAVRV